GVGDSPPAGPRARPGHRRAAALLESEVLGSDPFGVRPHAVGCYAAFASAGGASWSADRTGSSSVCGGCVDFSIARTSGSAFAVDTPWSENFRAETSTRRSKEPTVWL